LYVHLGHTRPTGGNKHPFARFHPMLHSKIYYMEFPSSTACAIIGSHNVTSFALEGLNGEASVMLEGPMRSVEFDSVRNHINTAREQSAPYNPKMKESIAWWTREFIDGMRGEIKIPVDWTVVRTILVFATTTSVVRPRSGDQFYFEIPAGIEQINSLATETHLYLFDTLPANPSEAIHHLEDATACFTCRTLGADNKQGNVEVHADWRIENAFAPTLIPVTGARYRPATGSGMQQVRAEVQRLGIDPYEYSFENDKMMWTPIYAKDVEERIGGSRNYGIVRELPQAAKDYSHGESWSLVQGLEPRKIDKPRDQVALDFARPESGSFLLVALRRRQRGRGAVNKGNSSWNF